MAINVGTAIAYLTLDRSPFQNSLHSAGSDLKNFANSGDIKSLGSAMTTVGKDMSFGVTAPLAAVGTVATKASMDFEAGMSKVKAISGATGEDFNKLREQAIQLGADTNFSASEAAGGMENLASAGFKTNEIMTAMPGMLSLAAAGGVDIATASDIAGSSLRGFGLEADKATHVADVLAKVAGDTNAGITDTGEAMKYISPVAHALGISLEDTSAAIGLLSNAGIKGSQAGTTLRGALTNLASPSKKASRVMKELGMNFFDAQGKMLPLGQVIGILQDKTKGLTKQQKASTMEALFGKEAMSGMLALVDQGPQKFNELSKGLKNCDGASKKMADTMQDNLKGSIEAMKGSLETAAIRIGDVLAPTIKKAADFIATLTNKFSALPKPIQSLIVHLGMLLALIGPIMLIFGKLIGIFAPAIGLITKMGGAIRKLGSTFSSIRTGAKVFSSLPGLISPHVLIVTGIIMVLAFIVYQVIKHWDVFKKYLSSFGTFIKNIFQSIWNFIKIVVKGWIIIFQGFGDFLGKVVKGWMFIFSAFGDFLKKVVLGWILIFKNLGTGMFELGKFIVLGLINGIKFMFGKVGEVIGKLASKIKDGFKSLLGIHSPSTVFFDYGVNTGEGYVGGVDSMKSKISDKMKGLAGKIKDLGNVKPDFNFGGLSNLALSGTYGGSNSVKLGLNNRNKSVSGITQNVNMYITIPNANKEGTNKIANEFKSMAQNSLKNVMMELCMNDVLRD